jgi:hypothetical protein
MQRDRELRNVSRGVGQNRALGSPLNPLPVLDWEQGKARDRLEELVKARCEPEVIRSFLIALKALTVIGPNFRQGFLPRGMTQKLLGNLLAQIEKMAEKIALVNKHKMFDPKVWVLVRPPSPLHPLMQRDFVALPEIMRSYAEYVEARTLLLSRFRQGYGRKGIEKRHLIRELIAYVRKVTNKPHYEALAELLSSALPEDPIYDADALRHLESRLAKR